MLCLFPKFMPPCDGLRRWGFRMWSGREGGCPVNGIRAPVREPRELPHPFYPVRTQQEACSPEGGPHPTTQTSSLQDHEKYFSVVEATQLVVFCYGRWMDPNKNLSPVEGKGKGKGGDPLLTEALGNVPATWVWLWNTLSSLTDHRLALWPTGATNSLPLNATC